MIFRSDSIRIIVLVIDFRHETAYWAKIAMQNAVKTGIIWCHYNFTLEDNKVSTDNLIGLF